MPHPLTSVRSVHVVTCLLIAMTVLSLTSLTVPAATAQDLVGIYWDTDYTTSTGSTETIPGVVTGYVVLRNPTGTGGVLGWEACIDVDGPAAITGWDFQGEAVNVGSAPCLVVGYTVPLPAAPDILLATFDVVVTETGPVELTMKPLWSASLPHQMSYIPGDEPGELIAMNTIAGHEIVAGLNGGNSGVTFSALTLDFGTPPVGETVSRWLTITNDGQEAITVSPSIPGFCDFFALPGGLGPFTVSRSGSLTLEVTFSPIVEQHVTCTMELGTWLPSISLVGTSTAPVPSWYFSGSGDFGEVLIGHAATRNVQLINSGQTIIDLDAAFSESCPDFVLTEGGGIASLAPGDSLNFSVDFVPTIPGYQTCHLGFGHPDIPDILFTGTGRTPETTWAAPTAYDFLAHFVGFAATANIAVTNTGTTMIPILAALPTDCEAFTILQGGNAVNLQPDQTHVIQVQFLAATTGHFHCLMDLGCVVPEIRFDGDAIAAPNAVITTPSQLVFPSTLVTQSTDRDIIITSTVTYEVPLDVRIDVPDSTFSIIDGGGEQILPPGGSLTVSVRFLPLTAGDFAAAVFLGENQTLVPLSGTGYAGSPDCRIEPSGLNFGDVNRPSSSTRRRPCSLQDSNAH